MMPVPAFATGSGSSVTSPQIIISSTSAAAAQVTYKVEFTVSATGGLAGGAGTISLVAPAGTAWPATAADYSIEDQTTSGGNGTPSTIDIGDNGQVVAITVPNTINNSDQLIVKVLGVANPLSAGSYTIGVETSADTALADSTPYAIGSPTSVGAVSVTPSTTSANATGVSYITNFTLSSTGGLVSGEGTITLSAPEGTVWPSTCSSNNSPFSITDHSNPSLGTMSVAICSIAGSEATLTVPNDLNASDQLSVSATGVTNPPVPPAGSADSMVVSTSSDSAPSGSAFSIVPFTSVQNLTVVDTATGAGAQGTELLVGFIPTGELLANESSISLSFQGAWWPTGDPSFPAPSGVEGPGQPPDYPDAVVIDDYTTNLQQLAGATAQVSPQSGQAAGMTIPVSQTIQAGDKVVVVVNGVINPPEPGTVPLTVVTSSDLAPATSPITLTAANSVSNVTGTSANTPSGAPEYQITFTTSATGTLVPGISTITLVLDAPPSATSYCITDTTAAAGPMIYASKVISSSSSESYSGAPAMPVTPYVVTLGVGNALGAPSTSSKAGFCAVQSGGAAPTASPLIAAGDTVEVDISGTNSAIASQDVFTSSDDAESSALTPPAPAPGAPSVTLSPTSTSAGAMANYALAFTAPTYLYGQNTTGPSFIQIVFPAGSMLTSCQNLVEYTAYCPKPSFTIQDTTTTGGSASGTIGVVGGDGTVVTIPFPNTIEKGDNITLTISSVMNPPGGTYSLGYSLLDPGESAVSYLGTQSYTIQPPSSLSGPDAQHPAPTVQLSTAAANATGVTYTINFSLSANGILMPPNGNLVGLASSVALTAGAGTIWPPNTQDYNYVDLTAAKPGAMGGGGLPAYVTNGGTAVGQLVPDTIINSGDSISLVIAGVQNPPAGTYILSVTTTSDSVTEMSAPYTIGTPNPPLVSSVSSTSTLPSASGATYTFNMSISSTGGLAANEGLIYLSASAGTVLPPLRSGSTASYSITDNTTPSGTAAASAVTLNVLAPSSAVITVANAVSPGDSITLAVANVTNPRQSGASPITVWTSSDSVPVTYQSFSMTTPSPPESPYIYMSSAVVDQTGVTYTIDFNTSALGVLAAGASSITVIAPPDTGFSGASFQITDDTTAASIAQGNGNITLSGGFSMVTIGIGSGTNSTIASSSSVTVVISGVTNAPQSGGTFTILTSSDSVPAKVVNVSSSLSVPSVTSVSPDAGTTAGGYATKVAGSGFELATGVSFGGTPAPFTIVSATLLAVTVPKASGPGEVDVAVTNAAGQSSPVTTDKFTYVQASAPTTPAGYVPVSPVRLADTRCTPRPEPAYCNGENLPPQNATLSSIGSQSSINVTVAGVDGVPSPSAGTTAVALNVTLAGPKIASGYLSVYPASMPAGADTVSNINWDSAGAAIPNLVMVAVSSQGEVTIHNGSSGTVDVTVDLEGYYSTSATGPTLYNPVTPVRLADSRCSATPRPSLCAGEHLPSANAGLVPLASGGSENVAVEGTPSVPSGATAAILNVTVTRATSSGYLTVWPSGKARATVSNLNWVAGKAVANRVIVPLGSGGKISVFNGAGSGTVDFIVDLSGYFSSTGLKFSAVNPIRICDTRDPGKVGYTTECSPKAGSNAPLQSGQTLLVQVGGVDGIPSTGVQAVVGNVTAAGSTAAGGFLSVLPGGTSVSGANPPSISDVNWGAKEEAVANLTVVKAGAGTSIEVFNSAGATNVIVDVMGWYTG